LFFLIELFVRFRADKKAAQQEHKLVEKPEIDFMKFFAQNRQPRQAARRFQARFGLPQVLRVMHVVLVEIKIEREHADDFRDVEKPQIAAKALIIFFDFGFFSRRGIFLRRSALRWKSALQPADCAVGTSS
jgi:hypothetical protein